MYFITGANLFGQWLCDDVVISEFREFTADSHESGICLSQAELLQINWSYNIFSKDGIFYITGAWDGATHQLTKIPISTTCHSNVKLKAIGNDYKVYLIGTNVKILWVIDLKKKNEIKKVNFYLRLPLEDFVKKPKLEDNITKAVLASDCSLFLTSSGYVFSGIIPIHVETGHCKGKVIDIKCGYEHYILLTNEGRVYTWGNGRRLQLGHGDISSYDLPMEVEALAGIKIIKISAGGWHSMALSVFGDVYTWGWNDTGQLGIKSDEEETRSHPIPTLIDLYDDQEMEVSKNIKDIACGSRHSAILLDDNTVWTTGCNKYGQLGFPVEKFPYLTKFKEAFHCEGDCTLMCGPWNTVLHCS